MSVCVNLNLTTEHNTVVRLQLKQLKHAGHMRFMIRWTIVLMDLLLELLELDEDTVQSDCRFRSRREK